MAKSKRSSSRSPKDEGTSPPSTTESAPSSGATLGFEQRLWQAADKLRNNMDAAAKGPGVVTGRYGTIGQVFLIWGDFWPLNTTLYLQDAKGNDMFYRHYLLSRIDFLKFSDKAAVPGINRNHLHEEKVVRVPVPIQKCFGSIVGSWLELIRRNNEQAATLAAIRDALLPRLLSGELTIPDAERIASKGAP